MGANRRYAPHWIFDPDIDVYTVIAIHDGAADVKGQHVGNKYTVPIDALMHVLSRAGLIELGLMESTYALMVVTPKANYKNMHVKEEENVSSDAK